MLAMRLFAGFKKRRVVFLLSVVERKNLETWTIF